MSTAQVQTALSPLSSPPPLAPSWPSWSPLGHLRRFRADPPSTFIAAMQRGDLVRLRLGHRDILVASHPDLVHQVLVHKSNNYVKGTKGYETLRALLGRGLLTAEGEVWKRQRKVANPSFQHARLGGFAATMSRAAEDLVQAWEPRAGQGELDMAEEMMRLTLRIAGETLFSMDISRESSAVGQALGTVLKGFLRQVTSPFASLPLPATLRYRRAVADLDAVVREIIRRRRADPEAHDDLLSMFMGARDEDTGHQMDDDQLRDELLTMLLAGHETTGNALAWTLYRLSQHPEADARLAEELAPLQGPIEPRHFPQLQVADRTLREAMRLHPPAWVESRRAVEEDTLGGYRVPADSFVFMPQYAIHRNPRLWEQPEAFDPDRFLPTRAVCPDGSPRPRLAWFPFGAGQRKCIGEHFAMMEARIVLATLARRYRFVLRPGHRVQGEASVTLRPKDGLPMTLQRR